MRHATWEGRALSFGWLEGTRDARGDWVSTIRLAGQRADEIGVRAHVRLSAVPGWCCRCGGRRCPGTPLLPDAYGSPGCPACLRARGGDRKLLRRRLLGAAGLVPVAQQEEAAALKAGHSAGSSPAGDT